MALVPKKRGRGARARLAGLSVALCIALFASQVPCASGVEAVGRNRPSWHDARRSVRGPNPNDAGDAESRRARALAQHTREDPVVRQTRRTQKPEPAHHGWGARAGHQTQGGSGRDGLRSSRRKLLADADEPNPDANEAANRESVHPHLEWPSLADVPAGIRCSGCELVLAAVHASAVTAARRLNPPSWVAASEATREYLVEKNWNAACALVVAGDTNLTLCDDSTAFFHSSQTFVTELWERATLTVVSATNANTTINSTPPGTTTADGTLFLSACALLKKDARASLQMKGTYVRLSQIRHTLFVHTRLT